MITEKLIYVQEWFTEEFCESHLMDAMQDTVEDSPYHREANVKEHTIMVFNHYMDGVALVCKAEGDNFDEHGYILGAFAAAFHDVGKPISEEVKQSESRGEYRVYTGHEKQSARLWEDFAANNWRMLRSCFDLTPDDIFTVGWMIQTHLPYSIKKNAKLNAIARTLSVKNAMNPFFILLNADTAGRISDPGMKRIGEIYDWCESMKSRIAQLITEPVKSGTIVFMIAPSGAGKSTYIQNNYPNALIISPDELRMEWYPTDSYEESWLASTKDDKFWDKVFAELVNARNATTIIIDEVNTTTKSRARKLAWAKAHNRHVKAVLIPSELSLVLERQNTRDDKTVPAKDVTGMFMRIQLPSYGDFDEIEVHDGNLPH
jgi:predicted kinase